MPTDEDAIRQLVATWLDASRADTDKVLSLMTDDVVFLTPGHPPMRGKRRSRRVSSLKFDIQPGESRRSVSVTGPGWTRSPSP